MTPDAVLCMTLAAAPGELSPASGAYLASVRATLRRHFPQVTIGWGDPAHVLAATKAGLVATDVEALAQRYSARSVDSDLFHPLLFAEQLDPDKVRRRAEELDAVDNVEISTDLRPVVYVQRLALWDRMTGGPSGHMIERLQAIGWIELIAALAVVASGTVIVCYLRGRKPQQRNPWISTSAIILSVGTTGFVTMALSIVWLYAFQNLYGYVYQRIGWIIAVFMGGLVLGCWLAGWRVKARPARSRAVWRRLIGVDLLLAFLSAAVPVVLPALGAVQDTRTAFVLVEWAVLIMVAWTGLLGGAAFALAGGLQLGATGRAGAAAGQIVGADHAGACAGALITGILLVPVLGTAAAAFLLAGMKCVSAALLVAGSRSWRAR
jgi:spermidine synthase